MFIGGGDVPEPKRVKGGLLGADYRLRTGSTALPVFTMGRTGTPICAPLTPPGVDVKPGEYLLEVEGREVRHRQRSNGFFENTAGEADQNQGGPERGRQGTPGKSR